MCKQKRDDKRGSCTHGREVKGSLSAGIRLVHKIRGGEGVQHVEGHVSVQGTRVAETEVVERGGEGGCERLHCVCERISFAK